MKKVRLVAVLTVLLFVLTACSSGGSGINYTASKTYTRTGSQYTDDAGNVYNVSWTNKTTIMGSSDKMHVRVIQEETVNGNAPFVHDTVYTFSRPIEQIYFYSNEYRMLIIANGGAALTAKTCEVRKSAWTNDSPRDVQVWVAPNGVNGNFYNSYTLQQGVNYIVGAEHYEPECAPVTTYVEVQ